MKSKGKKKKKYLQSVYSNYDEDISAMHHSLFTDGPEI